MEVYVCRGTNMAKMVVVIWWGAAPDVDLAGLAQSHQKIRSFSKVSTTWWYLVEGKEKGKSCCVIFKGVDLYVPFPLKRFPQILTNNFQQHWIFRCPWFTDTGAGNILPIFPAASGSFYIDSWRWRTEGRDRRSWYKTIVFWCSLNFPLLAAIYRKKVGIGS